MKTFVRVAEVWVPSADGSLLELSDGLFDTAPAFGALSRRMCFGRSEGLPGRAWDEGRPLLLNRFEGSYFRRTTAAQAAGLHAAIALPVFVHQRLTSVVVLMCGESAEHVGAIELWHNNPRITTDLRLADGYFGSTEPALETLTRDGSLPRGAGLPGLAWQRDAAVFMDQLAEAPRFLRKEQAAQAGIVRGLALPCATRGSNDHWVLTLLSSAKTPIARRVESWSPVGEGGAHLQRAFGWCETGGTLPVGPSSMRTLDDLGPVGQSWRSGVAQVGHCGQSAFWISQPASLSSVLAMPVVNDGVVSEVLALYY